MRKLIGQPAAQLRISKWWPTPLQMRGAVKDAASATFFTYLDDWFYREFSQISHLSLPGLIHSAGALLDRNEGEEKINQMRGYHFMQVIMVLISIYSEIEAALKIGVTSDLKYLWEIHHQHYPFAKEIYDRRGYASRLA